MSRRFFVQQSLASDSVRLEGAEAWHLSRVMRFQPGDLVTLFDGQGVEAAAQITSVAENLVELSILSRTEADRPHVELTLATAVPKGERFDWLVEKSVELGVTRIVPLITARSIVNPGASKLERLRRTIVEASKQCGRSRLMELAEPVRWNDFVSRDWSDATLLIADPSGEPATTAIAATSKPIVVAVGPEGGFTPAELDQASQAGARLVSIAPWVLRIETAAIAFAALIAANADQPL